MIFLGNDSVTAIRQWGARTPQDVLHRIGVRYNPLRGRYTVPSERTFRRVLAGLDGDALDAATGGYAADVVRGDAPSPVIAAGDDEPVEREQRRAATRAVAGMMLTLDALHTTKKTARLISGPLNAHYTLILKGNQPLALQAAQPLLAGTDTEFADHTDVDDDRGHRRTERRTPRVATCDDTLFPGTRQVFRLRRDTGGLDGARTSKEIIHGIVSLDADQAGPDHLNHYVRGHWAVENRLHERGM